MIVLFFSFSGYLPSLVLGRPPVDDNEFVSDSFTILCLKQNSKSSLIHREMEVGDVQSQCHSSEP